jgi:hypothetical protein
MDQIPTISQKAQSRKGNFLRYIRATALVVKLLRISNTDPTNHLHWARLAQHNLAPGSVLEQAEYNSVHHGTFSWVCAHLLTCAVRYRAAIAQLLWIWLRRWANGRRKSAWRRLSALETKMLPKRLQQFSLFILLFNTSIFILYYSHLVVYKCEVI